MKVLNFGSLNYDYVYRVPHIVQPGETIQAQNRGIHLGGKGLNQSIAMAKAGLSVHHAGMVGKDGDMLLQILREYDVDIRHIQTCSHVPSGHAIIQVDTTGENCILVYGGANQEITTEYVNQVIAGYGPGDVLVLQNEISNLAYLMQCARQVGMRIVLNPAPYTPAIRHLPLRDVDILLVNEIEGAALSCENDAQKMIETLQKQYQTTVVLTLGKEGAMYADGSTVLHQPIFSAEVVDTTCAGDTFTGYFLAATLEGMLPKQALALASRAAAITVSRRGAAQAIPLRNEVVLAHKT